MSQSPKTDAEVFRADIKRRGVSRLIHFTTLINLLSIFEQGAIMSRSRLKSLQIELPELHLNHYLTINDKLRLDFRPDFINLSVEMPNLRLLTKFKSAKSRESDSWCMLSLHPDPITWHDTLFSVTNAASSAAKAAGIGPTINHWNALFGEFVNDQKAGNTIRTNAVPCIPTDAQAEVLVKGEIPISFIKEVIFENDEDMRSTRGSLPMVSRGPFPVLSTDPNLFI